MTDPNKIFSKDDKCLPLDTMMDYIHDRLSMKERHVVEKHTLQCEFCNESMEGLSLVDENKGKEIIESIDEVNMLEDHILYAASMDEASHLEESKMEYELAAPAPRASMPSGAKNKKMASVGGSVLMKESKSQPSHFNWSKIAASIALVISACGGLYYFINSNNDKREVAVGKGKVSKYKSEEPAKNLITDSAIAISPQSNTSVYEIKPNSDGVLFNVDVEDRARKNVPGKEKNANKDAISETDAPEELTKPVTSEPARMAAPAKGEGGMADEVSEYKESESDKKADFYSSNRSISNAAKSRKVEEKAVLSEVAVADSVAIVKQEANSDFDKGLKLYTKGEYLKATKYFESVSKSDSSYEEAKWYLAKSYLNIEKKDKAKIVFKEIVEINGVFKARAEEELKKLE